MRLQILELPEGVGDDRAPFVLVVDESVPQRFIVGMDYGSAGDYWQVVADRIGARGVIVTPETVEIPANDVSAEFRTTVQDTIAEQYEAARRSLSDSETLGHTLLQRAENAEGRSQAMEVQRDRANRRVERAEAERVAADNMLRAVCEVFGGTDRDPVVKARETMARAEQAEAKLSAFVDDQLRLVQEVMDKVTDVLGVDRLRDWDEIIEAVKVMRAHAVQGEYVDGHLFGTYGYADPMRCCRCKIHRTDWVARRDVPSCDAVLRERGRD
ncbi:hypothetical protein ACFQ9H_19495 [Streptomyces sp. NPDC056517]|uniref:hypothetical protein n=1 Tax=Streptomyces sp. NPDC056517 TaxID=3345848 RepID=UPI003690EB3B